MDNSRRIDAQEIEEWLIKRIADLLDKDPREIDPTANFDQFGLDSATAVSLTGDLSDWLGVEVDPTVPYDHPTIAGVARHLS